MSVKSSAKPFSLTHCAVSFRGMWLTLSLTAVCACGRYLPPVPPEVVAPRAVRELAATAGPGSVTMTWQSPEVDRRSRELMNLEGYTVYRKVLTSAADVTNPDVPFENVTSIEDRSVAERERLRNEARARGEI